jgi:hypothetical protein
MLGGTLAAFYAGILIAVHLRPPMTAMNPEKAEKREPLVVSVETR